MKSGREPMAAIADCGETKVMISRYLRSIALTAIVIASMTATAQANPGKAQVFRASNTMEKGVESCAARLQGKPFLDCVANEMSKYSTRLAQKGAEIVAPQGAPNAAQAASAVKAAPTPAAAASVLNRVASVVSGLATSGERDTRLSYNRINQAFARAATILGSKS